MKEAEFYKSAFEDAAFRRTKLDELRYFRKVEVGMLVFAGVGFAAHTLYAGLTDGGWNSGIVWLAVLAITGGAHAVCSTRIAALQAIEERA
jgi:hypothetical protein